MTRIRIPAPDIEADVTAEQVAAYLLRPGSGWAERNDPTGYFREFERGAGSTRFAAKESAKDYAYWLGGCVDDIVRAEGRHPSAVLADIEGPARGSGIPSRGETAECGPGPGAPLYRTDIERAKCKLRMVLARKAAEHQERDAEAPSVPLCADCGDPLDAPTTADECSAPHGAQKESA